MASFWPRTAYNEIFFLRWYFNSPFILIQLATSLPDIYKGNMVVKASKQIQLLPVGFLVVLYFREQQDIFKI